MRLGVSLGVIGFNEGLAGIQNIINLLGLSFITIVITIVITIGKAAFISPTSIPDTSGKTRGACCPQERRNAICRGGAWPEGGGQKTP